MPIELPEVHLLVRYQDSVPGLMTVNEHEDVLRGCGRVWFGKFGKRVGQSSIRRLRQQISDGTPTYAFLTTRSGGALRVHRSQLGDITDKAPPTGERASVPSYYDRLGLLDSVCLWLLMESLEDVGVSTLEEFIVASSRRRVPDVLHSSAPFLLITQQRNA